MVLDASLLNTLHYKLRIKGKVEQSRERSNAFPNTFGVVAIKKAALGWQSTTVPKFTYFTIYHPYQDIIGIFPRWSQKYRFVFVIKTLAERDSINLLIGMVTVYTICNNIIKYEL